MLGDVRSHAIGPFLGLADFLGDLTKNKAFRFFSSNPESLILNGTDGARTRNFRRDRVQRTFYQVRQRTALSMSNGG